MSTDRIHRPSPRSVRIARTFVIAVRLGLAPVAGVAVVAAAALPACFAPTLPVPPPSALTVSEPDAEGLVTITGTANPDAIVSAFNEETGAGVIQTANGSGAFTLQITAASGDGISVWQRIGSDESPFTSVVVP